MSIELFTDGGIVGPKNPSKLGGVWAFRLFVNGTLRHQASGAITAEEAGVEEGVSNNLAELLAVVKGVEYLGDLSLEEDLDLAGWHLYCDSKITLLRCYHDAKLNGVPDWLRERLFALIDQGYFRAGRYTLLDGHPTKAQLASGVGKRGNPCHIENVRCDDMCNEAKERFEEARR